MLVLIDADPIVYRCGFAAEKNNWHIVYSTATSEAEEIEFVSDENGSAGDYMKEWMKFNDGKVTILDKSRVVVPDPLSFALRAVKVQVESIMEECEAHHKEGGKMLMYLSGKGGSYRDKIAKVRPYKGNRDPTHKPYHYDAIRDYLRAQYKSLMTSGIEADDAVSIFAHNHYERGTPERLVIATIDKDLDQIPGHHYNYMHKVFYAITEPEAERFFVYQILAGDQTDNIVGVWRCGEAAATRIANRFSYVGRSSKLPSGRDKLEQCPPDTAANPSASSATDAAASEQPERSGADLAERNRSDESGPAAAGTAANVSEPLRQPIPHRGVRAPNWWPTVIAEYASSQRKSGCPYAQDNPEAIAVEMAQLVKLQEYPGQLWHPHGDLVVQGFGEEDFDAVH